MMYRKLFDWIDGDDACEATAVTLYSAHDPSHDGERDFIIRRVKSLIETGVTIQSIILKYDKPVHRHLPDSCLNDVDGIVNAINGIYDSGETIETMIIEVSIKENHWT